MAARAAKRKTIPCPIIRFAIAPGSGHTCGVKRAPFVKYLIIAAFGVVVANSILWINDAMDNSLNHGLLYFSFRSTITILSFFIAIPFLFVMSVFGLHGSEAFIPVLEFVVTGIVGAIIFCLVALVRQVIKRWDHERSN
jgi:hypothetical protein